MKIRAIQNVIQKIDVGVIDIEELINAYKFAFKLFSILQDSSEKVIELAISLTERLHKVSCCYFTVYVLAFY